MKDVLDNSNKELFNVISTFAGGGGSSTGYRLAGGKILCVNEFVEEPQLILTNLTIQTHQFYLMI